MSGPVRCTNCRYPHGSPKQVPADLLVLFGARWLLAIGVVGCPGPQLGAQQNLGFDNRKPSGQPYLAPEESRQRLRVPPGVEVKLFAAEPDIINPIAFTVDERGRLWVVESHEY